MYTEWKTKYKHSKDCLKPNKNIIKKNTMFFNEINVEEWNKIYQYCAKNYCKVPTTRSKGISNLPKYRFKERYMVILNAVSFELIIVCGEGLFRFILKNKPKDDNTIKGGRAAREIYKQADAFGVDLTKYTTTEGLEVKKQIKKPHNKFLLPDKFLCKEIPNCHHLDLNSAYASEIAKEYPELRPMYDSIYKQRKDNNGYFKHVLTNSIGCFQSETCPNYFERHRIAPFQLAPLSKVAVNGTHDKIEELIHKLRKRGCVPILTNVDGIWYHGNIYHDKDEGTGLGQWKNDHTNVTLLVRSVGAYQYLNQDKSVGTVIKGPNNLDLVKTRDHWEWREILKADLKTKRYYFDPEKGVCERWQNV